MKRNYLYSILSVFIIPSILFGASSIDNKNISWFLIVTSLFGGLGMFLYGMEMMSDGMKLTAGNKMRSILEKLTSNRFLAVGVGGFVTMVIQSSSATTVMLVSFVNSGLLTFAQGLGVILGSNIGSTVTAQIVAFKVTDYALALIAIGALMSLFSKKESSKNIGFVILGFGLLFYGMKVMSDTMKPLRANQTFNNILVSFENPFMGILAGAIFTALVQSSSATTGIVITLASGGSITIEAGIPLIFGANVGTCVTALLAGLNASREAKRIAIAHVLFNVTGVLLFCFWIPTFSAWMVKTADNIPRQIANAHTFFNIFSTVIFIPFTSIISELIIKYFPDKDKLRKIEKPEVLNLDENVFDNPAVAISNCKAEIRGVVGLLERVIGSLVLLFISKETKQDVENADQDLDEGIQNRLEKIDYLNKAVSAYLIKINNQDLNDTQSREIFTLVSVINYINLINSNINLRFDHLIEMKKENLNKLSDVNQTELINFHGKMLKQIKRLGRFFEKYDKSKIEKIIAKSQKYRAIEEKYRIKNLERISSPNNLATQNQFYSELMDLLKETSVFVDLIASSLLELESIENLSS